MDQVYMRVCKSVSACSEFICVCVMLWVYMHGSSLYASM